MQTIPGTVGNPWLGVLIFTLGGLAGALFYLPLKKIRNWAWESYWMVYAISGLLVVPWLLAFATSPNVLQVLSRAPAREVAYCFVCGAIWGFGGLTFGLMIRYLGVGLGLALGLGLTSATGTLIPPMLKGQAAIAAMYTTSSGLVSVAAAVVSLAGIVFVGLAGRSKERELPEKQKKQTVAEFNFKKGILVAIFSGLTSSGMNFGLQGGTHIQSLALSTPPATSITWSGAPVLCVVLLGGFVVNAGWCLILNVKNMTGGDYVNRRDPLRRNFMLAIAAGAIWCAQFVCLKTGEPRMGRTAYLGWAVLMASSILFSQLFGLWLGEWTGTSRRTVRLLLTGLAVLFASVGLAGYSGYITAG